VNDLTRATEIAPKTVPHRVELGLTFASEHRWQEAKDNLEKALAMPKAWVTDDYYWEKARQALPRVKSHLD
jgi:Tfp pilus assembly protein PilF